MTGNSFGNILQISSFGESHGIAIGGILQGFPAGFSVDFDRLQKEVDRRRPGHSEFTSPRKEEDKVEFLSGIYEGKTLGTPIAFLIRNRDVRSADYEALKDIYRPSHADFTWEKKYGLRDYRGGGRSSARETLARVVAGALAQQYLEKQGIKIVAMVKSLAHIEAIIPEQLPVKVEIDRHALRCPDTEAEKKMLAFIKKISEQGDTAGGVIAGFIQGLPTGLGEPVFDKFQARLASAMMSINAAKGFAYGEGFNASGMLGSEHNDAFEKTLQGIKPKTNHAGGILGGITTGEDIIFRIAVKPTSSISKEQKTIDITGKEKPIKTEGRHDPCICPRIVPVVEAMTAIDLLDLYLINNSKKF